MKFRDQSGNIHPKSMNFHSLYSDGAWVVFSNILYIHCIYTSRAINDGKENKTNRKFLKYKCAPRLKGTYDIHTYIFPYIYLIRIMTVFVTVTVTF